MTFGSGHQQGRKKPLYFFYDSETTDRDVEVDKIVEVAAVIHLASLKSGTQREFKRNDSHEFSSLCYCDRELSEIAQKITGLTKWDLRHEPSLREVLENFLDWISESIAMAERLDQAEYIPVLVAHSGLDFPMLLKEIDKYHSTTRKFRHLNIRLVDTFNVFKDLKRNKVSYRVQLESLSMENIYKAYFHFPYDGHRALADAQALCRIFSEAAPAEEIELFTKYTQTREEMDAQKEQIQKFCDAGIKPPKAVDLLAQGITYEKLVWEYQRSPHNFRQFLKHRCGIKYPKPEVMEHFRELY